MLAWLAEAVDATLALLQAVRRRPYSRARVAWAPAMPRNLPRTRARLLMSASSRRFDQGEPEKMVVIDQPLWYGVNWLPIVFEKEDPRYRLECGTLARLNSKTF